MPYQPSDILLDKYRIEERIGRGAFAEVYRATHLNLNVTRAVKILDRETPGVGSTEFKEFLARFQLEAQLGAKINTPTPHPTLLQVHDFQQSGELLLLEMEYASGGSLADRIARARESGESIPIEDVIQIAQDIAGGLATIHGQDIVHRDLKPSNILFDHQGVAKVADLGLAQIPGGPSMRSRMSEPVPHPGTPGYMSPEQKTVRNYLSSASDIYSLGLVLFETLTGRVYLNQPPGTQAGELRSDIPSWLDELLASMLSKMPEDRPWNGEQISQFLREGLKQEQLKQEQMKQAARKIRQERIAKKREEREPKKADQQPHEINRLKKEAESSLAKKDWKQAKELIHQLEILGVEGRAVANQLQSQLPNLITRIPTWSWIGVVLLVFVTILCFSGGLVWINNDNIFPLFPKEPALDSNIEVFDETPTTEITKETPTSEKIINTPTNTPTQEPEIPPTETPTQIPEGTHLENSRYGYEIYYSDAFRKISSPFIPFMLIEAMDGLELVDNSYFDETNLKKVEVGIGASTDSNIVDSCTDAGDDIRINSIPFKRVEHDEVAAGTVYEEISYRTKEQGVCYEIGFIIASGNMNMYSEGAATEFDKNAVLEELNILLSTFNILD